MNVMIQPLAPDALEVRAEGVLKKDDYAMFVPLAEERIREHGHVNILIRVDELHGISPLALWEDLKFDARHYNDVERVALVGADESRKQRWMKALAQPFTSADIKHFGEGDLAVARDWIRAGGLLA